MTRLLGLPLSPEHEPSPSWRHLMTHYKDQLLACDFFTVETLSLQTLYVLVLSKLGRVECISRGVLPIRTTPGSPNKRTK